MQRTEFHVLPADVSFHYRKVSAERIGFDIITIHPAGRASLLSTVEVLEMSTISTRSTNAD
jgi:hypothetical protein